MFRNVVAALNEAQDITLFLKPMTNHFQVSLITHYLIKWRATLISWNSNFPNRVYLLQQSLETSDFPDIIPQLRPLMHCICLVYSRSTFYNSPARIIVIMQETCNMLIDAGRKYIDPASLFQVNQVKSRIDNYWTSKIDAYSNGPKDLSYKDFT